MIQVVFILLVLALLSTVARVLWIVFPALHSKEGRIFLFVSSLAILLPLLLPALVIRSAVYSFSVILTGGILLAIAVDNRPGSTAFELYPVALGLVAPLVIITDFVSETPVLHRSFSSPVVGLLIGLGTAAVITLVDAAVTRSEPLALSTAELCAAAGFFAGYPGVLWVLGFGVFLCLLQRLLLRRFPVLRYLHYNSILGYCLLIYLCGYAVFGI